MKHPLCILSLLALASALSSVASAADDGDSALNDAVRAAVAEAGPSVMRIETFGGLEKVGDVLIGSGPSTGIAVGEDGYVLCSAYSFAQQPTSILVTMPSGKRAAAKVIARDHSRMLVLLKVNSEEKLQPAEPVARTEMTIGQTAIALGRTFDSDTPNVSVGILSATNRIWGKAIQTDAKISPSNYGGPLIDLHGKVLGILVPMSPQGEGALAGAQWYDSGIGFAVPLAEVLPHLDTMKRGEDLHPGKLGVSLSGKDNLSQPVQVAAVLPGSPASKAGIEKDDVIVEVAGQKIRWLAQLKHALGPRYAGEELAITVKRGDENIETSVTLAGDVPAYDTPFLGVLPMRGGNGKGVAVRYVYPKSPAEEAGLKAGDLIVRCQEQDVDSADQLRNMVGTHDRKTGPLAIELERDGKAVRVAVEPGSLPEQIPDPLPAAHSLDESPQPGAAIGLVPIKVPEIANDAFAFVPASYRPDLPHSLIVWLDAPGEFDKERIEPTWGGLSEKHNSIVLVPRASNVDAWQPTESEFVRKAMDEVIDKYNIDDDRVVVGGYQAGGTFAAIVATAHPDAVRGIALVDAAPPARASLPTSDPVQRLSVFVSASDKSKHKAQVKQAVEALRTNKIPVSVLSPTPEPAPLDGQQREHLSRWVDSLDRI